MEKSNKSKKEAKEEKLRDQKIEEQVLNSLESAATPEEKFRLLLSKYVETERANKRLRQDLKVYERQFEGVQREKENLQREYNKGILMRDKLQEVCREQQKLIKSVKNESMQKLREEEERRKESQTKFQSSLNEISQSLSKNNEENLKLRDHNIEMSKKLKFLAEQYQLREQQFEKLNEQLLLETQLRDAKLNKVQMEAAMEKEILTKEKQIALEKLLQTQKMLKELTEREKALKEQLNLYTAKYDDFQSSLQKSNDTFATYKIELDKMSKQTRKLEKESLEWKRKWEKSNAIVIDLATEKQERDEHAARCTKQVDQLQKLLRALQTERTQLHKLLRENKIDCPPLPSLPPEPEPLPVAPVVNNSDKDRMDLMSRNCAELKETLTNLQNQVKNLHLRGTEAETQTKPVLQTVEDNTKKRQKKKQKSRNNRGGVQITKESASTIANNGPQISVEPDELKEHINGNEEILDTEGACSLALLKEKASNGINENLNGNLETLNAEEGGAIIMELTKEQQDLIPSVDVPLKCEELASVHVVSVAVEANGTGIDNETTDDGNETITPAQLPEDICSAVAIETVSTPTVEPLPN